MIHFDTGEFTDSPAFWAFCNPFAIALIKLNPFERLAGRTFYEASETDLTRVPDDIFITWAENSTESIYRLPTILTQKAEKSSSI